MAGIEHGNIDNTIYIVFKRYYSAIVKYMEIIHRKIPPIFFFQTLTKDIIMIVRYMENIHKKTNSFHRLTQFVHFS
jgi:hypothetical protein